ncbi:MAG: hypothetical protein E7388_03420 [Ruminococcaceae bacterium]|nr:hypothetical protein [Oscillospiraceae bacterium]
MLCERCKKNQATMRLTRTVNNKKTVVNLCPECAREVGAPVTTAMDGLGSILSGLMGLETMWKTTPGQNTSVKKCPSCGMTRADISNSGKLGCAECYITFIDDMRPLLRKIHGNCLHHGSVPENCGSPVQIKSDDAKTGQVSETDIPTIENLKSQMQEAIKKEDFETAAALRDRIKALLSDEGRGK